MFFFLLFFILVVLWKVKISFYGYNDDFLSKERTNAIKGFFIVIVFINHIKDYYAQAGANLSAWYDNLFFLPSKCFGQLMVVMFLFYSGYGVMESIKRKGKEYVNNIPKRRVWSTLLNFDVAVVAFTIATLLMGKVIGIDDFFLSLLGWDDMGNSNWYIFAILVCYGFSYVAFSIDENRAMLYLWLFILSYILILSFFKGTWWYNTVLAYPLGVLFSMRKDRILVVVKRHYLLSLFIVAVCFLMFLTIYLFFYTSFKGNQQLLGAFVFNFLSMFFALMMVIITMKVSVGNNALFWLGTNLFPLYIYQRLPMLVLTTMFPTVLVANHPYVYFILCFGITIAIAWVYKFFQIKLV